MKTLLSYSIHRLQLFGIIVVNLWVSAFIQGKPVKSNHIEIELISESVSTQPGRSINIGIRMLMDEHWHTYWTNPGGEIGLPTKVSWDLPNGFSVTEIQWPYPHKFVDELLEGEPPLVSYGYEGEILLITTLNVPDNLDAGAEIKLGASISWLACETMCIPGSATIQLSLPILEHTSKIDTRWTKLFSQSLGDVPLNTSDWEIEGILSDNDKITFTLVPPKDIDLYEISDIFFIPFTPKIIIDHAPQTHISESGFHQLSLTVNPGKITTNDYIEGLLISKEGWRGTDTEKALKIKTLVKSSLNQKPTDMEISGSDYPAPANISFVFALLSAFAGGLILNLMPCVLPVLSLKVLSFVKKAGGDESKIWKHGIVFTAGVLVSFWLIAGLMIILRHGGRAIGWGYQLQSPTFLVILIVFLFAMSLSLFGVFEIGTGLIGVGSKAANKSGYAGSFFIGMIAVFVATPCMAPFMSGAIAYAITQPPVVSASVFTVLGLGLSTPYLLLSCFPSLIKFVPKPGAWMESFKQLMGFPLMATVVWLLWVLGRLCGVNALSHVMLSLVLIGMAAWIFGRWGTPVCPPRTKQGAYIMVLILVTTGLFYALNDLEPLPADNKGIETKNSTAYWQPFSTELLINLRTEGKPVFIDFTADWCLTCKANEKFALNDSVLDKFMAKGVTLLKADFTHHSPEIADTLANYGRSGVPLYVFYGQGIDKKPHLLPQLLTERTVLAVLDNI